MGKLGEKPDRSSSKDFVVLVPVFFSFEARAFDTRVARQYNRRLENTKDTPPISRIRPYHTLEAHIIIGANTTVKDTFSLAP
jgi:hypothetical protein